MTTMCAKTAITLKTPQRRGDFGSISSANATISMFGSAEHRGPALVHGLAQHPARDHQTFQRLFQRRLWLLRWTTICRLDNSCVASSPRSSAA